MYQLRLDGIKYFENELWGYEDMETPNRRSHNVHCHSKGEKLQNVRRYIVIKATINYLNY